MKFDIIPKGTIKCAKCGLIKDIIPFKSRNDDNLLIYSPSEYLCRNGCDGDARRLVPSNTWRVYKNKRHLTPKSEYLKKIVVEINTKG